MKIILILLAAAIFPACANLNTNNLPTRSFVKFEYSLKQKVCDDLKSEKCLVNLISSEASGAVVKNTQSGSYILTVNHMCTTIPDEKTKISISKASGIPVESMLITSIVTDMDYQKYEATVSAYNEKDDLCLLYAPGLQKPPLKTSIEPRLVGDQVTNLAAPAGVFFKGIVPVLKGTYSGSDVNVSLYTIPAILGSSGGPILNEDNELVGIVSKIHRTFYNIVLSPTSSKIKQFLEDKL